MHLIHKADKSYYSYTINKEEKTFINIAEKFINEIMYSHGKPKIPVSQKDFYMNFLD
jgi:hypothetical protein